MCMHAAEQTAVLTDAVAMPPGVADGSGGNSGDGEISLSFWNVDAVLKCPVVGMCLTLEEQRRMVKKAGLLSKKYDPFEIHEILVSCTNDENPLARKVDALLRKKFERQAALLRQLEASLFMRHWKDAFASGDFAAALWAGATRGDLSEMQRRSIFGAIHMAMHGAFESCLILRRQLEMSRREREKATDKAKTWKQSLVRLHREQHALREERDGACRALAQMKIEKEHLKNEVAALRAGERLAALEAENRRLRTVLAGQAEHLLHSQEQRAAAEHQLAGLAEELEGQQRMNARLKEEMRLALQSLVRTDTCDSSCPSFASCKKRVLIVGGMTRMESLYRQLVESSGGSLDYHDGYLSGGVKQLEKRLQRADIVLCPVNCNSHGACAVVKSLGKKHNKPVYMMSNFSLSAVSRAIGQNAAPDVPEA